MAGRPETPLDPDEGPVARLAHELRELRARAGGPTYRDMARESGCGASTLSNAAAGRALPTLAVVLAYAAACGADPGPWEERWRTAAEEAEPAQPADADAAPPYRGLRRYEPADRDLFFGREAVAARLAERVGAHRLIALVGPSGSGKSSLLRAGLIPLLREERAQGRRPAAVRILTPGPDPLPMLSRAMTPAPGDGDTVVLVDQFEEVFTLCADPVARAAFLDLALTATAPGSRLRLVLAMRADYFGRCAEHRGLAESLRETTLLLGPMSPDELREAIVRPAASAGLIVERALTSRIIREVGEERGALPLMSHALLETWRRRHGRALTEEMYEAAGGIHGAIAHTAEEVYGGLTDAEALAARRALLRLVTPGEGAEDVRRSAGRAELDTGHPEAELAVRRLADARLLTLDDDTVDLAHEALITAWPRYRAWIEEDRETLRLHRRLTEAARAWDDLDRDPGALYRGVRLATACDAFGPGDEALTPVEAAFLDAGRAARDADTAAAARTAGRLRTLTLTLSVLLVLALTAGFLTWHQSIVSDRARHQAQSAEQVALSDQLSEQSTALLATDPDLASLLAVEAYRTSPTPQARDSLYAGVASPLRGELAADGLANAAAFSPDGRTVAVGYSNTVALWNTATGTSRDISTFPSVTALSFDSTGHTLTLCYGMGYVRTYDLRTGTFRTVFGKHRGSTALKTLGPGGRTVVAQGRAPGLRVFDLATGRTRYSLPDVPMSTAVVVAPTGNLLANAAIDGTIRLWDLRTGALRATVRSTDGDVGESPAFAFSPDGRLLAVSTPQRSVNLLDTRTGHRVATLTGPAGVVTGLAFSPDGRTLAGGAQDRTVRLWDVATGRTRLTLTGLGRPSTVLVFGPGGRTLVSGQTFADFRLWDVDPGRTLTARPHARGASVAFSPDGRELAVDTGTVHLWDAATGGAVTGAAASASGGARGGGSWATTAFQTAYVSLPSGYGLPDAYSLTAPSTPAFGPDGHPLITGPGAGVQVRDTVTGAVRTVAKGAVRAVLLGPDGHTVATVGGHGRVRVTDTATGRGRTVEERGSGADALAFSADDRLIGSVSPDGGSARVCPTGTGPCVTLGTTVGAPLAIGPDDRTVAVGDVSGGVALYDLRHPGASQGCCVLDAGLGSDPTALAFSPDGRTLAVGDSGGTVRLWDLTTRRVRTVFSTGHVPVDSVAFSPDGRRLAAGDALGTARLWALSLPGPAAAVRLICQDIGRDLTPQEREQYVPSGPTGAVCPTRHG